MLSIYICEDNPLELRFYKNMIENLILMEEYDMQLEAVVTNPEELLYLAKQHHDIVGNSGFYLLDIELNADINGFELARRIREFDSRGFIAFITAHSELAMRSFQHHLEAIDFICKKEGWLVGTRLRACLDTALQRHRSISDMPMIAFKTGSRIICIEQCSIIFIAASLTPHKVQIVSKNGTQEFYGTLKSCSEILSEDFIRCHKSYIVNIKHIANINHKSMTITLTNGDTCFASSKGIRQVLNAIHDSGSFVAK